MLAIKYLASVMKTVSQFIDLHVYKVVGSWNIRSKPSYRAPRCKTFGVDWLV